MTQELLIGLVVFAFVGAVTPGPNNLMLMASGANFGFARTLPHMGGICLGHAGMVFLVGIGLGQVFLAAPALELWLKVAAAGYVLFLGWKIAHAAAPEGGAAGGRPFTFLQAAAFQWVNPKAWALALTAVAAYAPQGGAGVSALVAGVFALVSLPSVGVWTVMGREVRRLLRDPRRLRAFNRAMAVLLVLSLWPVLAM